MHKLPTRNPIFLTLIALAGLLIFLALFNHIYPYKAAQLGVTRTQAIELGEAFLKTQQISTDGYHVRTLLRFDHSKFAYLQDQVGRQKAVEMTAGEDQSLFGPRWNVYWFLNAPKSAPREEFIVNISGSGKLISFQHHVPDSYTGTPGEDVHLSLPAAMQVATDFLASQSIDLEGYELESTRSDETGNRTDHLFVWQKENPDIPGAIKHRVQILGNKPGLYNCFFELPEERSLEIKETNNLGVFAVTAAITVFFAITIFLLSVFLKKYHEGEIGVRSAGVVFVILWLAMTLESLIRFSILGDGTSIGDVSLFGVSLVILFFSALVIFPFWGLAGLTAWSVGESMMRKIQPAKLNAIDSLLNHRFTTRSLAESIGSGYALGIAGLGLFSLLTSGAILLPGVHPVVAGMSTSLSIPLGFLFPILTIASSSLLSELVFRFFGNQYLGERLGNRLLPILITSVLWSLFSVVFWDINLGTSSIYLNLFMVFLMGLFFSWIIHEYDLMTVVMANFTLLGVMEVVPMFTTIGQVTLLPGIGAAIFLLLPAVVMSAGLIRKDTFEYQGDSTPAHIRRITERERMAKELEIAHQVQMSLLPKASPTMAGLDIAGICIPAKEVGGDYYDFITMGPQRVGIAIGDVSGKGVPAAIYMTLTKGVFQSNAEANTSPRDVLVKVNHLMYRTIERGSFVSMFYAVLDVEEGTMRFARAGHNPALYMQGLDKNSSMLEPGGIALGLDPGEVFSDVIREQEVKLERGDILVFYTDGFTEAMDRELEEYGEDRMTAVIRDNSHVSAKEMVDAVCMDVREFVKDFPQHDDMTMVVVKVV